MQQTSATEKGSTSSTVIHDLDSNVASFDKDLAAAIVPEHAQDVDALAKRRVLRKIDLFLIPWMWIGYGFVYYDKAILGSAVLFGMTKDLSLSVIDRSTDPPTVSTNRLSWATSMFYFGMLAGLYPMTFLLQRFHLGRLLGGLVILWGMIAMLTAAVTSWQGLFAQRFFLGFMESIIPTSFMCIVSGYYTQQEQALRQSWWFSSTGGWTIIGGALNYGFAQITGGDLRGWQYIYLLAGSLTILFGIVCFAVPNSPVSAWFLSAEDRVIAVERLRSGQTGVRCQKLKGSQMKEAALDIKIWIVAFMMAAAYTVNGAVSGFGPLIVSTFGYTTLDSILLQFPLGGLCFVFILVTGWLSSRIPNIRLILLIICCFPVIAGCAMIWRSAWTRRAVTPVAGYTIIGFFGPVVSLIISIGMANVAGATKKSCTAAAIFVAYCVGNSRADLITSQIIGPQLIKTQTLKRHYPELWLGLIICYCIVIVLALVLYAVLRRENSRRASLDLNEDDRDRLAFMDLTDQQNPYFRYRPLESPLPNILPPQSTKIYEDLRISGRTREYRGNVLGRVGKIHSTLTYVGAFDVMHSKDCQGFMVRLNIMRNIGGECWPPLSTQVSSSLVKDPFKIAKEGGIEIGEEIELLEELAQNPVKHCIFSPVITFKEPKHFTYPRLSPEISLIASGVPPGAVGGSLLLGPRNEAFGRRMAIIIPLVLYTVGTALEAGAINFDMMVAGRVILGLGVGLEGGTVPVYVVESVASKYRGNLVSHYEFNIALGEVFDYIVAAIFVNVRSGKIPRAFAVWKRIRDIELQEHWEETFIMKYAVMEEFENK
ncbi:MAG: hypothetical protein Q9217_003029 [Psora testacea]